MLSLWETNTPKKIYEIKAHHSLVNQIIRLDYRFILTCSNDGFMKIWRITDLKIMKLL